MSILCLIIIGVTTCIIGIIKCTIGLGKIPKEVFSSIKYEIDKVKVEFKNKDKI